VISAGLDTENLLQTLRLIMRELKRFTESPPSAAELRRARDYTIGQIDLSLESTDNQMNWLGEQLSATENFSNPPKSNAVCAPSPRGKSAPSPATFSDPTIETWRW